MSPASTLSPPSIGEEELGFFWVWCVGSILSVFAGTFIFNDDLKVTFRQGLAVAAMHELTGQITVLLALSYFKEIVETALK